MRVEYYEYVHTTLITDSVFALFLLRCGYYLCVTNARMPDIQNQIGQLVKLHINGKP
jgi:hypothetical protein